MEHKQEEDSYITIRDVMRRLNVCRASVYLWIKDGFPQPIKLGKRASRWSAIEVEEWIKTRPKGTLIGGRENG